MASEDNNYN